MEGWCAVQHYRVILDNLFQEVPDFRAGAFCHALCAFNVVGIALYDKRVHNERLEQFKGHLFGQAALVHFELRARNDD